MQRCPCPKQSVLTRKSRCPIPAPSRTRCHKVQEGDPVRSLGVMSLVLGLAPSAAKSLANRTAGKDSWAKHVAR